MNLEELIESYRAYKSKESLHVSIFYITCKHYNEVWKTLEEKSKDFKTWDLLIVKEWCSGTDENGPRNAFKNWSSKQTRFDFEEFHQVGSLDWNSRGFVVFKYPHVADDSDYYEWSD